jgi:acetyl esterase/lipase
VEDVTGLPPVVINVTECDPLRDEGVEFYRLLMRAGTEILAIACPDVSQDIARDIAAFARD